MWRISSPSETSSTNFTNCVRNCEPEFDVLTLPQTAPVSRRRAVFKPDQLSCDKILFGRLESCETRYFMPLLLRRPAIGLAAGACAESCSASSRFASYRRCAAALVPACWVRPILFIGRTWFLE